MQVNGIFRTEEVTAVLKTTPDGQQSRPVQVAHSLCPVVYRV